MADMSDVDLRNHLVLQGAAERHRRFRQKQSGYTLSAHEGRCSMARHRQGAKAMARDKERQRRRQKQGQVQGSDSTASTRAREERLPQEERGHGCSAERWTSLCWHVKEGRRSSIDKVIVGSIEFDLNVDIQHSASGFQHDPPGHRRGAHHRWRTLRVCTDEAEGRQPCRTLKFCVARRLVSRTCAR